MPAGPLLLLDSASMYFRAFHALPTTITGPHGRPTNAVHGFLDQVARVVALRRPARIVACFDADWRPQFRVDALPQYKAHRVGPDGDDTPQDLRQQVPVIEDVLDALGIARAGVAGYEADDVIATLATTQPPPVEVMTGDRDLFQLVDDSKPVRVLYPGRRGLDVIDERAVSEKYGIPGRGYADFALLRGDPSDGLPGVPGIGETTAAGLLRSYGDLTGILTALQQKKLTGATARKLEAGLPYLTSALTVVLVARDVPVPRLDDELLRTPRHPESLTELAERHGIAGPVARLVSALANR